MDDSEREYFRQRLLAMRRELAETEVSGAEAERTVELDQARVGRLSRMDAMQLQAMSRATGRRRRQMLREIERALERILNREYGECAACGEDIATARLEIQPATRTCIRCARNLEREAGR